LTVIIFIKSKDIDCLLEYGFAGVLTIQNQYGNRHIEKYSDANAQKIIKLVYGKSEKENISEDETKQLFKNIE
jgi:hypothetical protein